MMATPPSPTRDGIEPTTCGWTVDEGDLVVSCGAEAAKRLVIVGGREAIALCSRHATEVARLPNVAPADARTLVMRWA
jgi:hypothetical protein